MAEMLQLLILDACCLLNLCATGRLREIAMTLPYRLVVADYVLNQEALYLRIPSEHGSGEEQVQLDLSPIVNEGLVQVERIERPGEESLFVDLAAFLDDGEAVTGALALHRGYSLATDDRKARRVLTELDPAIRLVSTLELIRTWAETTSVSNLELREAIANIQSRASYVPGQRDPLYTWWRNAIYGSET